MTLPKELATRLAPFGELDQSQAITPALTIEEFFNGNEDLGSIGCNLDPHPGVGTFRRVLERIRNRPDVVDVRLPITEFIDGLDWPFVDNVIVVTSALADEVFVMCSEMSPDEAWELSQTEYSRFDGLTVPPGMKAINIWWD